MPQLFSFFLKIAFPFWSPFLLFIETRSKKSQKRRHTEGADGQEILRPTVVEGPVRLATNFFKKFFSAFCFFPSQFLRWFVYFAAAEKGKNCVVNEGESCFRIKLCEPKKRWASFLYQVQKNYTKNIFFNLNPLKSAVKL